MAAVRARGALAVAACHPLRELLTTGVARYTAPDRGKNSYLSRSTRRGNGQRTTGTLLGTHAVSAVCPHALLHAGSRIGLPLGSRPDDGPATGRA